MGNESDFNHPVKIVWRDLLRKHMLLGQEQKEVDRKKLIDFILQYETIYHEILKDELQT